MSIQYKLMSLQSKLMGNEGEVDLAVKWNIWTTDETNALIQVWKTEKIQNDLATMKRNKPVFQEMVSHLREQGYRRAWSQVKSKLATLITTYKSIKEGKSETGQTRETWPFFDAIDEVLGDSVASDVMETVAYSEEELSYIAEPPISNKIIVLPPSPSTSQSEPEQKCQKSEKWGRKRKTDQDILETFLEFEERRRIDDNEKHFKWLKMQREAEERQAAAYREHEIAMAKVFADMQANTLATVMKLLVKKES